MKRNLSRLLTVLALLLVFVATVWAGTSSPLNTKTNVSCVTGGATAIAQSTPVPNDTTGQPNRLCVTFQDLDATNSVFVGDCVTTSTTTGYKLSSGAVFTYCGSSAICCFGATATVLLGVTETTKQ